MLQTTDCFHMIHIKCFKDIVFMYINTLISVRSAKNGIPPKCPDCSQTIAEVEYKQFLTKEEVEDLEKEHQLYLVRSNPNFIQCSCGCVLEIMQGKVDYNQKDDEGKQLSR